MGKKGRKPPVVERSPSEEWFEEIGLRDLSALVELATERPPAKKQQGDEGLEACKSIPGLGTFLLPCRLCIPWMR